MLLLWTIACLWQGLHQGIHASAAAPDFAVTGIKGEKNNFVYIKLENRAPQPVKITPALREKIFLTIYIDNVKRAEYKVKHIDPKLFRGKSVVRLRTNFRFQSALVNRLFKIEVNPGKIIPEKNYRNNTLSKRLRIDGQ